MTPPGDFAALVSDLSHKGRGEVCVALTHSNFIQPTCDLILTARSRLSLAPPLSLARSRAQGMPGDRLTRSSACKNGKHADKSTTGSPDRLRPSLRNGFNGFLRARPGDRAWLSPSPA